jgi:hypothetical protein
MVKVLVVTRCHAQYGAVHNHRDLCDTPLGISIPAIKEINLEGQDADVRADEPVATPF